MILKYLNRTIEVEVDHSGAACDAFFCSGNFLDGKMESLTDEQLDEVTFYNADHLTEYCLEIDGFYKE